MSTFNDVYTGKAKLKKDPAKEQLLQQQPVQKIENKQVQKKPISYSGDLLLPNPIISFLEGVVTIIWLAFWAMFWITTTLCILMLFCTVALIFFPALIAAGIIGVAFLLIYIFFKK